jgi:hypothetical protein
MITSTVPAALTALLSIVTAAVDPAVPVFDGMPAGDLPDSFVIVGYSDVNGSPAVTGEQSTEGGGAREEVYDIACLVSVATGDSTSTTLAELRTAAAAIFAAIEQALTGNDTLNRAVGYAYVGGMDWIQQPTSTGAVVSIAFFVHCEGNQGK